MQSIPLTNLAFALLPVAVVLLVLHRWSLGAGRATYALARMVLQLLAIGYVLTFFFKTEQPAVVLAVLTVMLLCASWIALGHVKQDRRRHFGKALAAIALGGVTTLALVTQGVLHLDPWFSPREMIPLAGMIFAGGMNSVSLAAERLQSEQDRQVDYFQARQIALRAALIPITNSLLAVGLVQLPGFMTGQILSGVDPLVAARYQIMVMCMLFGSAGIAAACYLAWVKPVVDSVQGEA